MTKKNKILAVVGVVGVGALAVYFLTKKPKTSTSGKIDKEVVPLSEKPAVVTPTIQNKPIVTNTQVSAPKG